VVERLPLRPGPDLEPVRAKGDAAMPGRSSRLRRINRRPSSCSPTGTWVPHGRTYVRTDGAPCAPPWWPTAYSTADEGGSPHQGATQLPDMACFTSSNAATVLAPTGCTPVRAINALPRQRPDRETRGFHAVLQSGRRGRRHYGPGVRRCRKRQRQHHGSRVLSHS